MCMNRGFDFIADIHGQYGKLTALLERLGYASDGSHGFRHPDRRQVVFLGDYIDRGPKIRETLQTVRAMVDAGDALAIMGNHEFNAIAWATPAPAGHESKYLRHHGSKNRGHHSATLSQFEGLEKEWADWLGWFKQLPLWLDLGGARAVHACWDEESMALLSNGCLTDPAFFEACAIKGTREYDAIETILKGPELDLPQGVSFLDKQNIARMRIRSRWWHLDDHSDEASTYSDIAMPPGSIDCQANIEKGRLEEVPSYTDTEPVFFGHYWLPSNAAVEPMAEQIACLDFSAGLDGPLVAYRWNGEQVLDAKHMIAA